LSILSTKRLDAIDWDFPGAGTGSGSVHGIFSIPGNFIPQIPAALIQILSKPGDLVLDPFSGSGTTLVEAVKLGRNVVGLDSISACVLTSEAKLLAAISPITTDTIRAISTELAFDHFCKTDSVGENGEGSNKELTFWYDRETLAQLRYIWKVIEVQPESVKKQLLGLFASLLFACASTNRSLTVTGKERRHHWGWVADNVRPKQLVPHNAIVLFRTKLAAFANTVPYPNFPVKGTVLLEDVRSLSLQDDSVDLVVTSPPYIGVIDYTHAHRLMYLWMGWSMEADRVNEIGARFRRFRKNAVKEYILDMKLAQEQIHRVLKKGRYCAFVIGESKKFPGTTEQVVEEFTKKMPLVWGPKSRYLCRRRVADREVSDPVEHLCVFQKK
jgi:hypothetical protein